MNQILCSSVEHLRLKNSWNYIATSKRWSIKTPLESLVCPYFSFLFLTAPWSTQSTQVNSIRASPQRISKFKKILKTFGLQNEAYEKEKIAATKGSVITGDLLLQESIFVPSNLIHQSAPIWTIKKCYYWPSESCWNKKKSLWFNYVLYWIPHFQ